MKVLNSTLAMVMMAAGIAAAQAQPAAPPSQAVKGEAKAKAAKAAAPKAAAPKAAAPKAAAQKSPFGASAAAQAAPKSKTAAPKTASRPARPAGGKAAAAAGMASAAPRKGGKRDPFVSPVVRVSGGGPGGPGVACTSGKKCLVASEMTLRGVVRSQTGMIAVVENPQHKTYFLREKDPVFNGFVTHITADSVTFRESMVDSLGNPSSKDVEKKLAPTT